MLTTRSLRPFIITAITILSFLIIALFFQYDKTMDEASKRSELIALKHVENFSRNIEMMLRDVFAESIASPLSISAPLREKAEEKLSLFVGEQYPYVYLIAKDEDGKYRYVIDGSRDLNEKGVFGQKFDPESKVWEQAFSTGRAQWKVQDKIYGLWVTYLKPIKRQGDVLMVLAFDFSTEENEMLNKMFSPIRNFLMIISSLLIIVLVLSYLLAFLFYRQKKKTSIDPLTKLFNRHFLEGIDHKLKLNRMVLAVLDIDHFKHINDSYGHLIGDIVLQQVAKRLKGIVSPHDIVVRYGGEEFLLLIGHDEDPKKALQILHRIQQDFMMNDVHIQEKKLPVKVSIGVNPAPHKSRSLKDAIEIADKMLYVAKTNGRNRVEVYESLLERSQVRHVDQMADAINEDRLQVMYQPIALVQTGEIVKYEALVRIIDKEGKMQLPLTFLPYIKKTMVYRTMTKSVLSRAFSAIKAYRVPVSVNFDAGDFFDDTMYEIIYNAVKKKSSLASMLTLELLEDREIKDIKAIAKRINALRNLGVRVAIDDFGSGYSTFSYLMEIKPDYLKIDGSLIKKVTLEPHVKEVVLSIVNICSTLGIETVAEFVQDQETMEVLKELRVDYCQGTFIGKPSSSLNI